MNIDGVMTFEDVHPIVLDSTINNGDGTFGNWRYVYHGPALTAAGLNYNEVSATRLTVCFGTETTHL